MSLKQMQQLDRPLSMSIDEYIERIGKGEMIVEQGLTQGLNGTTAQDLYDVVCKPKHYMLFDDCYIQQAAKERKGIEVRDVISLLLMKMDDSESRVPNWTPLFESDYVQLLQYIMRFMDKNGVEDLKKARWYLDKMIEAY